jgi:xanthine/CO dehydrogenase XdhC/CoxF family maturation factor
LLDSYNAERRPVFESTMHDFIAKSIETDKDFLDTFDPDRDRVGFEKAWQERSQGAIGEVHAFEPHYEGSPVVAQGQPGQGACSARGSHRFEARAGHHLAPATLASGENVFEILGEQFTLLAFDASADVVQMVVNAARSQGLPLTVREESKGSEADRYQAQWVLVRPDQFIAWVGHDNLTQQDIQAVLAMARGQSRRQP